MRERDGAIARELQHLVELLQVCSVGSLVGAGQMQWKARGKTNVFHGFGETRNVGRIALVPTPEGQGSEAPEAWGGWPAGRNLEECKC